MADAQSGEIVVSIFCCLNAKKLSLQLQTHMYQLNKLCFTIIENTTSAKMTTKG
jgi:hypothetical protein